MNLVLRPVRLGETIIEDDLGFIGWFTAHRNIILHNTDPDELREELYQVLASNLLLDYAMSLN